MSQQSFQAIRRLQDSGAALPLVVANPAWQALLDKIDSNISERSGLLQDAISKLPLSKRSLIELDVESTDTAVTKRQRVGSSSSDLDARKQALLSSLDGENPNSSKDSYEAYRRQCWEQYYDWMDNQQSHGDGSSPPSGQVAPAKPAPNQEEEDDEIHNALLGLS